MAELNLSDDLSFETKRKVREKMRLELFCNEDEFEEWLKIANYSNYADGEDEENIKIREDFRQEMKSCLENTKKLQKDFKISFGLPILLVFREKGSIIGTGSLRRDEHKVSACQVNTIAIAKDKRRQGLGKKLMDEIAKLVRKHSDFKYLTLTTSGSQGFYQKIGMRLCGVLDFGKSKRYFFARQLRR